MVTPGSPWQFSFIYFQSFKIFALLINKGDVV